MSHGLPPEMKLSKGGEFRNAEWLYDLHWYEENRNSHYQITNLPLVVECEWEWKRKGDAANDLYSAVKWDFQKLLVTNADLRVMIFRKRPDKKHQEANEHLDNYFDETIHGYRHLAPGSKFLFIAFDETGFRYNEKSKGRAK